MFENTANIPSIDGKWCTQCASVVISQFRQYLGSCANSGLKNVSHVEAFLFICNILFADQSCYFVCRLCKHCCRNFNNVHCFRTIFPNRNSAFASFCIACPVPMKYENTRNCLTAECRGGCRSVDPDGEYPKQRCNSEFAKWHDIYTPNECADELMQNNADFKWLYHEWFHHVRHHDHDGHSIE